MKDDTFYTETLLLLGFVFVTSFGVLLLDGKPIITFFLLAPLLFYSVFRAPVHIAARVLVALGLFIEPPDMIPGAGYWTSPLVGANETFYGSLKTLISFPVSFCTFFFASLVLWRRARMAPRGNSWIGAPADAFTFPRLFLGVILGLLVYGLARGGAATPAFFQVLQLVTLPIFTMACLYSIRGRDDIRAFATIIVAVAVARSALVTWVYWIVCRPLGVVPEYATTHGDSVIFDAAILILLAHFIQVRSKRSLFRLCVWGGIILAAIAMNNRRLAFVGLGAGAITMLLFLPPSSAKKKAIRTAMYIAPFLAAYVALGAQNPNSKDGFFAPARLVVSVIEQKDTSSDARDVENDNLLVTLDANPIVGPGFGFEYNEVVKLYDIAQYFPLYKYIAHNTVLWLWTIGGFVGFSSLWLLFAMQAFYAARGYHMARTQMEKACALGCLGITFVCITADWGDQGLTSWPNLVLFSVAYALSAKITAHGERALQIERDIEALLARQFASP